MNPTRLTRIGIFLYLLGYVTLRIFSTEIWEKDGRSYVIFPPDKPMLYTLFRPLSYLDETLTGTGAHIGPHAADGAPAAKS